LPCLYSGESNPRTHGASPLRMRIAIVLYPGLTALDAIGPYEVLNSAPGFDIRFVWKQPGPIVTDHGGLTLGATHAFHELPFPEVLLVPGSSANTASAMRDPVLRAWLQQAHTRTRFTTSVCSGALVLAAAGILQGHPATTHWAVMDALAKYGATPCPDQRVVRSDRIITAAGVSAGIDMALTLLAELAGQDTARAAQLAIEYDPRPPFDAGHASRADAPTRARAHADLMRRAATPRAWS
jgi:transcriptional regulator GlxA family with amidase domain